MGPSFSAAGIPLILPVSGVSEVGTSMIVRSSGYRGMVSLSGTMAAPM